MIWQRDKVGSQSFARISSFYACQSMFVPVFLYEFRNLSKNLKGSVLKRSMLLIGSPVRAIFGKKAKIKLDTFHTSSEVWPSLYAISTRRYHAAMDNCFGLVRPHQQDIDDTCRGGL